MWSGFVGLIEQSLTFFSSTFDSWGLAIIFFTVAIKLLTWPLTSKQIKSSKAMQELQPRMKALQEKYKDDKEKQTQETMKLYQEMGVNPLMGCLPMLLQFPIWIGLYQAIINLANQGALNDGFLFLESLAEPKNSMSWVTDFPNLFGGEGNWVYFILPVLTVVTQIAVSKLMSPTPTASTNSNNSDDPTAAMMKQMTTVMPLMFGFFALQFPSGLALYWVVSNILTWVQYFVMNRTGQGGGTEVAVAPASSLAPLTATDGKTVIDGTSSNVNLSKGQKNDKSRRKRTKR